MTNRDSAVMLLWPYLEAVIPGQRTGESRENIEQIVDLIISAACDEMKKRLKNK